MLSFVFCVLFLTGVGKVSGFEVTDATISISLDALANEDITCVEFIQAHIDRVHAYDKTGPALTSITNMEGDIALAKAKELDDVFAATGNMTGRYDLTRLASLITRHKTHPVALYILLSLNLLKTSYLKSIIL